MRWRIWSAEPARLTTGHHPISLLSFTHLSFFCLFSTSSKNPGSFRDEESFRNALKFSVSVASKPEYNQAQYATTALSLRRAHLPEHVTVAAESKAKMGLREPRGVFVAVLGHSGR